MKNEIGNEILGIWRYSNDEFMIDFSIRSWDDKTKHNSFFTKIDPKERKIRYEWQALVDIIREESEWKIEIREKISTHPEEKEYVNLSIVREVFDEGYIVIKAAGGKDMVFNKIG